MSCQQHHVLAPIELRDESDTDQVHIASILATHVSGISSGAAPASSAWSAGGIPRRLGSGGHTKCPAPPGSGGGCSRPRSVCFGLCRPNRLMWPVPRNQRLVGNKPRTDADLRKNMKQHSFSATAVAAFAIALAAMIPTAPLVHAETDVETACTSSGGQYTSEVVRPHWDANPTLIETCCTGGASGQCVTYNDGVRGAVYGGG